MWLAIAQTAGNEITHLFTTLGLPTGLVAVLMWYQWKRDQRSDERQQAYEVTSLARENRLAERVTGLEGMVHNELMDIVRASTETQKTIANAIDQLDRTVAANTQETRALHAELREKPCLLTNRDQLIRELGEAVNNGGEKP